MILREASRIEARSASEGAFVPTSLPRLRVRALMSVVGKMQRKSWVCLLLLTAAAPAALRAQEPLEVSGRYPHLAAFNHQGECGTGAVVPWANRLWVITYAPHKPEGSDDKLYEIDAGLHRIARPESVGGTPANRLVHRESNQLNIGPYFIDARRRVRVIPPSLLFGRLTASARHLSDPANKLYICDMEGLIYEVDVHSLAVKLLFKRPVPGWHGKGAYTGQGRLVLAFNGESPVATMDRFKPFDYFIDPKPKGPEDAGSLCEWDGHAWRLIERRQFNDVTSRGGICGAGDDKAPLWAVGWDRRSVMLKLLDGGQWQTFRLPIADYTYFGHHGWHTEWPRIREVTDGQLPVEHARRLVRVPARLRRRPHRRPAAAGRLSEDHRRLLRVEWADHLRRPRYGPRRLRADRGWRYAQPPHRPIELEPLVHHPGGPCWRRDAPAGFGGPWLGGRRAGQYAVGALSRPALRSVCSTSRTHRQHTVVFTIEIDATRRRPVDNVQALYGSVRKDTPSIFFRPRLARPLGTADDRPRRRFGRRPVFHYGPGGPAGGLAATRSRRSRVSTSARPLVQRRAPLRRRRPLSRSACWPIP